MKSIIVLLAILIGLILVYNWYKQNAAVDMPTTQAAPQPGLSYINGQSGYLSSPKTGIGNPSSPIKVEVAPINF